MKESERRGEEVATKRDLAVTLKDVARVMVAGGLLVWTAVAVFVGVWWWEDRAADRQRDESFNLICSVLQQNAAADATFANSVVRLIRLSAVPPSTQVVQDVRATAAAVRDRHQAFAAARCASRDDLARLLERDVLAPPETKETP